MNHKLNLNDEKMLTSFFVAWSNAVALYAQSDEELKLTKTESLVMGDLRDYMDDEKPVSIVKLLEDWEDCLVYQSLMIIAINAGAAEHFLPTLHVMYEVVNNAYTFSKVRCAAININFDVCKPLTVDELITKAEKL